MPLTDSQLSAVIAARKLLDDAGLLALDLHDTDPTVRELSRTISAALPGLGSPHVLGYRYKPPAARVFTLDELALDLNRINRQLYVHRVVEHPVNAIVEFPETGSTQGICVAHKFSVDPNSEFHPKQNIQYSLGDGHGGHPNVYCGTILTGKIGTPALCNNLRTSYQPFSSRMIYFGLTICAPGKGLKVCSSRSQSSEFIPPAIESPEKEVFCKTLAFFCSSLENGCAFDPETELGGLLGSGSEPQSDSEASDSDETPIPASRQRFKDPTCRGELTFRTDEYGRPFIQ